LHAAATARREVEPRRRRSAEVVVTLLELGADPLILDKLPGGDALGWARFGGHDDLADVLP
jgi:hypothetical protein